MADRPIGSLPAAASIEDDSLLVAEQQGEAVHFTGKQLKDYAKSGLDALVTQAQTAAEAADKDATDAEAAAKIAAEKAAAVTDDAEAAAQAARTATEAKAAAQAACEAAENAKTAAEQAASAAAQAAADEVKATLEVYVTDAEAARDAAQAAAGTAADETVAAVRGSLQEYVDEANQAKTAAQNAAQTAADDAVAEATQQVAGYVVAAESAKEAAEKARDEAQAIVGGDFMDKNVYDPTGKATDIFSYVDEMLGSAGAQVAKATLPKGRMRGDVNGDGEISFDDAIMTVDVNYVPSNDVEAWCADVDQDGMVNYMDFFAITGSGFDMADYYGNWAYTDGYFHTDIPVEGLTAGSSAIVVAQGNHKRDAFAGAECMDGYIRIKANLLPLMDTVCLVFFSPGDGTAVVVPENVVERTGATKEIRLASSDGIKIFSFTITDAGVITATANDGTAYTFTGTAVTT